MCTRSLVCKSCGPHLLRVNAVESVVRKENAVDSTSDVKMLGTPSLMSKCCELLLFLVNSVDY